MENEFTEVTFIWNNDETGLVSAEIDKDFDYKNSWDYLLHINISNKIIPILEQKEWANKKLQGDKLEQMIFHLSKLEEGLRLKAITEIKEILDRLFLIKIPENFHSVLNGDFSKDIQSRFLDNQDLSSVQFEALIGSLYVDYGFTLSRYSKESIPKGIDEKSLPSLIYSDGDNFKYFGKTDLSEGNLKNIVKHRKFIIAYFFDKQGENNWHCFIWTYDGISGKEVWKKKESKPHIHYFSNKWGFTRKVAVAMIKQGNYPTTKVHINFIG